MYSIEFAGCLAYSRDRVTCPWQGLYSRDRVTCPWQGLYQSRDKTSPVLCIATVKITRPMHEAYQSPLLHAFRLYLVASTCTRTPVLCEVAILQDVAKGLRHLHRSHGQPLGLLLQLQLQLGLGVGYFFRLQNIFSAVALAQ